MEYRLKVALITSEVYPFSKTGGLADVSGALSKYVTQSGHDIRVITPLYAQNDFSKADLVPVDFLQDITLHFGPAYYSFSVHVASLPGSNAQVYFVSCPNLYNRASIYTNDIDEHIRFAFLSRAALEMCQRMGWGPDIMHCNDWQTALIPLYLKTMFKWDSLFSTTKTILTIHNLGYQGQFSSDVVNDLGFGDYGDLLDPHDVNSGQINFMKLGIIHADKITTVSKTYAKEIQTIEYGEGIDPMLAYRHENLIGIVNGVDYAEWSPQLDTLIEKNYDVGDFAGKLSNKMALLARCNLKYNQDIPVIGLVSRMVEQKGFDLILEVLEHILHWNKVQCIILGNGEERYENYFQFLAQKYPEQLYYFKGYNNRLAHQIEAGADMFLMPSRYEPCGLNQIYSLKYGTIPIVRKTGGLADTVQLYNWQDQTGTGFVFEDYTPAGLKWAMDYAISTFNDKQAWKKIVTSAMEQNFSWEVQVKHYLELYKNLKG